jgi:hypothetical protein
MGYERPMILSKTYESKIIGFNKPMKQYKGYEILFHGIV